MEERKPDTIVFTYETTVDYIVDLRTGVVQREDNDEIADEYHYVALFCEGEFAGEYQLAGSHREPYEDDDEALIEQAEEILDAACASGTVKS